MSFIHLVVVFLTEKYLLFYGFASTSIFLWKGYNLPYNGTLYLFEVALLFVVLLVQYFCIVLSKIGHRTKASLILPLTSIAIVYYALWQQYVLRIEVITNSIYLCLHGFYVVSSFIK